MNTTTAAIQAGVTIDTVRAWCRIGAVAAIKQAGRWIIDTASLATRVAIGKLKARKEATVQQPTGTMSDRGEDFVAKWPTAISRRLNLSPEWMATAMVRAGLINATDEDRLRGAFLRDEATPEIGNLTPAQAKSAIASLQAIARELAEASKTHCRYCGQELKADGTCAECGNQDLI